MAAPGGKDQGRSHVEENSAEKMGIFNKVKDSLNLTKHMGFVSDLDSPASQAALAATREKEEREGVQEVVPQAPLTERVMEGVTSIAATATEITTGAAGGVAPMGHASPEEAESSKEGEPSDEKKELSEAPVPKELEHQQERSNGPVAQDPEQRKHSKPWAHFGGGHKDKETEQPKAEKEKESHGFSKWALQAAHKLGDVVASKDLTDDPSAKKSNKK